MCLIILFDKKINLMVLYVIKHPQKKTAFSAKTSKQIFVKMSTWVIEQYFQDVF